MSEKDGYLLWFDGEPDGVLCGKYGKIIVFSSLPKLQLYSDKHELELSKDEPVDYEFDTLQKWCSQPKKENVDCKLFLDAWNLFVDIAISSSKGTETFRALNGSNDIIYKKLFYGNNLPSVTPPDCTYVPEWTTEEVSTLSELFKEGLSMFSKKAAF